MTVTMEIRDEPLEDSGKCCPSPGGFTEEKDLSGLEGCEKVTIETRE